MQKTRSPSQPIPSLRLTTIMSGTLGKKRRLAYGDLMHIDPLDAPAIKVGISNGRCVVDHSDI